MTMKIALVFAASCALLLASSPVRPQSPDPMIVEFGPNEWEKTVVTRRTALSPAGTAYLVRHKPAGTLYCSFPRDVGQWLQGKDAALILQRLNSVPEPPEEMFAAAGWTAGFKSAMQNEPDFLVSVVHPDDDRTIPLPRSDVEGAWASGQAYVARRNRCLDVAGARAWLAELRRVLRLHLGMPPS